MLPIIDINEDDLINAFWFAVASATQTYRRTTKSKQDYISHIYRIFIGKIGELTFLRWTAEIQNVLSKEELDKHIQQSLSIFFGEHNVDSCDILMRDKKIDVKTVPNYKYQWLIIPIDQWENQIKDYYVAIAVNIPKAFLLEACNSLKICSSREIIRETLTTLINNKQLIDNKQVVVQGYLSRNSNKWLTIKEFDKYCPEKECVRAELKSLEPIEDLFNVLLKLK
jgi:hypothetical protein